MNKTSLPIHTNSRRTRLTLPVWIGFGFLCVLLAFGAFVVRENYKSAIDNGEAQALSAAHVVSTHAEWMMEASVQALRRIDTALGDDGISSAPGEISNISNAVGDLPAGFTYSVFDKDGELRSSSVNQPKRISEKDKPYFQRLANGDQLAIARLQENEQIGRFAFVIARRLERAGAFHGVAAITIANDFVDRFWSRMNLGANSTISIIRNDGWLLARHPEPTEAIDLSKTGWFPLLSSGESGLYHSPVSPIDGSSRIVAFWKVDRWPIVALAAVDREEILTAFWRNLRSELLFVIPLIVMLAAASAWIVSLMRKYALRNDELETAVERNGFLLREIHHRVKNNLQSVMALIRMQKLPRETSTELGRRLAAMIAVHEQIYENDQFEDVDVAPYVTRIVREVATAYDDTVRVTLDIDRITVDREQALPLGMLTNEVVSNAFKYAFQGVEQGVLSVILKRDGADIVLTISDNGIGFDTRDARKGMGTKLITSFASQLNGRWEYTTHSGTVFTLQFPA